MYTEQRTGGDKNGKDDPYDYPYSRTALSQLSRSLGTEMNLQQTGGDENALCKTATFY